MIALLAAALLTAASPSESSDTVFTPDGGRITGTVIEEGPASGVTIQLPDGSLRRLEPAQVSRVEFADGTVSTPRATPSVVPATARSQPPEGPLDNVYLVGGGRVRGTVMEESAAAGTKVRLLDGSIRTLAAGEISRIDYADGTVSTPSAPAPRAAEPARPARPVAEPPAPSPLPVDNVYFAGGGRVRGTVVEESARTGVKVRLLDGSVQSYPREDLVRIEYADGSVSRRVARPAPRPVTPVMPAPAAPQPAPYAQPAPYVPPAPYRPPPPAPFAPQGPEARRPPYPVYLSVGVGATFLGGDAARDVPMSQMVNTEQGHVSSELGLRLSPSFAIGVYGDVTGGEPAPAFRDACQAQGLDCSGTTGHAGFLVRHTWAPASTRPTWLSLGTGWEAGGVFVHHHAAGGASELVRYTGREWLRLGTGVDFRSSDVLALGFYATFSVGEYDSYKDATGVTSAIDRSAQHTTAQVGLRLTLFP